MWKENVDIDILTTSRNKERKFKQHIRIVSQPPTRIKPIQPIQKSMLKNYTYERLLLHCIVEPGVQMKQQL